MAKWLLMTNVGTFSVSEDGRGLAIEFPDGQETEVYHEQFKQLQTLFTSAVRLGKVATKPLAPEVSHQPVIINQPEFERGASASPNPFVVAQDDQITNDGSDNSGNSNGNSNPNGTKEVYSERYGRSIPTMGMRQVPTPPEHLPPGAPGSKSPQPHQHPNVTNPNAPTQQSFRRQPNVQSPSMSRRPQESPPSRGVPNTTQPQPTQQQPAPRQGQPQPVRPQFTRSIDRMTKKP
jgi:hypothetical protein